MGSLFKPKYKDRRGNRKESRVWWIKYYSNGRAVRESSESTSETEARRLLRIKEGESAKGVPIYPKMDKVRFEELTNAVITDYEINERRSLRDIKMRFKRHILPFFQGRKAASITPADIQDFILYRKKGDEEKAIKAASNAEINRELAAIKRAFSLGLQQRRVMQRPYIPMLKERNVRTGFFEREPFEGVRRNLPEVLRGLVTFFYITGWRFSEVLSLKWHQVDLKAGRVYLEAGTTKNEDARVFPFTDELREALEAQHKYTRKIQKEQGKICPWVFHREGKQVKSFRRSWLTACRKAGVPGKIPHDFRRTAVRNLVRAGVPEGVAMKMTGHKTRSVFERYNIVNDADLEKAAKRLDAVGL
jgi:integrase